jgi:tetratricopeptide (TPR) repeat protein
VSSTLDRHVEALAVNPLDVQAFEALEEGYFLDGAWQKLVDLYDRRFAAAGGEEPRHRASLLQRAGQILEERCLDPEAAEERYTRAIQQDPSFRPALQQLRRIHAERGAWDLVLQIAEVESAAQMAPAERAEFLAEMGAVWLERLDEPSEAMTCFEQALEIDPQQKRGLAGHAQTLAATGQHQAAATAWERLIDTLPAAERAAAQVALAELCAGPLEDPDRRGDARRGRDRQQLGRFRGRHRQGRRSGHHCQQL